ncbi:MAG: hypothetical protein CNE98_04720 [Bacteroidetes bacterium MED-G17]|nr:MAG: hypothetical protein CNE98_04720 [Bacteroidetes bacterium MED-G17]CAI8309902.1 MAG: Uncharacterised protein [Bacteroidetes bacterium MED-G17]|tara:strand:+ start:25334 stop:25984 length:651 start_codon:yes stop_codon:yes gene_type:complete
MRIFIIIALFFVSMAPKSGVKLAKLKYNGGGDWYSNRTALPNLIAFCNKNLGTQIIENEDEIEVGSVQIFNYPYIYMTGHGNVEFSVDEAKNLRKYLLAGGFLHIDDNYGLDPYIRPQMKKVFPELDFVELPFSHSIYHKAFSFKNGLPKVHMHDNKPARGFGLIYEGRLVCFYDTECDLGNGWEDEGIYPEDSPEIRKKALQMGANIIQYVFEGY